MGSISRNLGCPALKLILKKVKFFSSRSKTKVCHLWHPGASTAQSCLETYFSLTQLKVFMIEKKMFS